METSISENQTSPDVKKKPHIKWLIGGILADITIIIILVMMDATIFRFLDFGFIANLHDSPVGKLKFFFVVLSIIALIFHVLRPNLLNWIMVPILLFMGFRFKHLLGPISSDVSNTDYAIIADNFSPYKGLELYPFVIGFIFIIVVVCKMVSGREK
ncbi:hypothetical protein KW850_10295 [Bacillus sp. sid0103]|uniref:hypothetical protein n=1 Tax=Bacillus sp. sid0103 TaxID=2856337 RepID=UPI001C437445|nr:hypothetical protein [Bacillus sp. sid0103]MBV7505645.1 hypothetical protein [Bacillus sp. sid0103]